MIRMMLRATLAAASVLAAAIVPAAASADGDWKCMANGNIPIATLNVRGTSYDIETSDGQSGTGELAFNGAAIVPQSGLLADEFAVVGALENSVLYWNNGNGTLMACWPR